MRSVFIKSVVVGIVLSVSMTANADFKLIGISPTAGPAAGGTPITITTNGGYFVCPADPCMSGPFLIGGVVVPTTDLSPTKILAIAPPHAPGVVDIEARPGPGSEGVPVVLQNAFTYLAPPTMTLISVSPSAGPASGGTPLTITFSGYLPCVIDPCVGPSLFIGGTSVPFTMVTPTTLTAVTPPHAPGPVSITAQPGIGTEGATSVLPNAFIFVGPDPVPTLSEWSLFLLVILLGVAGTIVLGRR